MVGDDSILNFIYELLLSFKLNLQRRIDKLYYSFRFFFKITDVIDQLQKIVMLQSRISKAGNLPGGTITRSIERADLCIHRMDGTLARKTMNYLLPDVCAKNYAVSCTTLEFVGFGNHNIDNLHIYLPPLFCGLSAHNIYIRVAITGKT
jgi:hypothetical protein